MILNTLVFSVLFIDRIYSYLVFEDNTIIVKKVNYLQFPYDIIILLTTFSNILVSWKTLLIFPLLDLTLQLGHIYMNKGDTVISYLIEKMENEKPLIALAVLMILQITVTFVYPSNNLKKNLERDLRRSPVNSGGSNNPSKRRKQPMF